MSRCACRHLNRYLPFLTLEREYTILGNLRIDLHLHMDGGPVTVRVATDVTSSRCQGNFSALCERNILVNRNRLTWRHLVHKEWLKAGKIHLWQSIGRIAPLCHLDQIFGGKTDVSYAIVRYSNGSSKRCWPLRMIRE